MSTELSPFAIVETSPGHFSLLLSTFEPASEVFTAAGAEGGGYAWEAVARHVVGQMALEDRLGFDPESSMFCAFGEDRDALSALGVRLARLFHDHAALARVIDAIGPDGFED